MKKKITAIALVVCMLAIAIAGATMAYFTDTETANNVMTVGKIDIEQHEQEADGSEFRQDKTLLPNVQVDKIVTIENVGNSDAYFRTFVAFEGTKEFVDTYLDITKHESLEQYGEIQIGSGVYTLYIYVHPDKLVAGDTSEAILTSFTLKPEATQEDVAFAGDAYNVWVVTEAVQADGFTEGAAAALNTAFGELGVQADVYTGYHPFGDTSWYNDTDTEFTLTDRADLLGFANLVNGGTSFSGKTVKLAADIDLSDIEWAPIGTSANPFAGTFDGQGHTISNMTVNGTECVGLFGCVFKGGADHATVKNVKVDNANISGTHWAGGIVGHGYADVTGCEVTNSNISLNTEWTGTEFDNGDKAGGIIGYVGEGSYQITGNTVSNVEIYGYRDLGGIAGYAQPAVNVSGNTVENVTITVDYSNNYKNYTKADDFDAEAIVGEGSVGSGNAYNNVTVVIPDAVVATAKELQTALDNAVNGDTIVLGGDIEGNVTVTQKAGVNFTIDGNGHTFAGVLTVDGKSGTYTTAGLTVKNMVFKADSISADACIRLGDGTNATRYTCNVTVDNCTFDVPGAVGVKSYTGGDKKLTITGCTVTDACHSLVQAKGIDGVLVENCKVYSKNGLNFNNSDNVTVDGCEVDVKGYAVRFGESSGGVGAAETYLIKNCSLKSANDDGDATIILRGTADYATLTIENTTIAGTPDIANTATGATVIK